MREIQQFSTALLLQALVALNPTALLLQALVALNPLAFLTNLCALVALNSLVFSTNLSAIHAVPQTAHFFAPRTLFSHRAAFGRRFDHPNSQRRVLRALYLHLRSDGSRSLDAFYRRHQSQVSRASHTRRLCLFHLVPNFHPPRDPLHRAVPPAQPRVGLQKNGMVVGP